MSLEICKISESDFVKNPCLLVKVVTSGNVVSVQYMSRRNNRANIKMLPGCNEYVELSTGEIKECNKKDFRSEQFGSLRRTFETLRGIINSNVVDPKNCKWITLTYGSDMVDTKQLKLDFNLFDKRFQYWCKKNGYPRAEYITVVEPQGSGRWHHHLIYIFPCVAPYIPNDDKTLLDYNLPSDTVTLNSLWGHGFTKTKKLSNVDNVGAYLTAYLADIEITEENVHSLLSKVGDGKVGCSVIDKEVLDSNGTLVKKSFIKGARLHFYPPKFNIFRCSRGVKRPVYEFMTQEQAKEKVSSGKLTFSKTVQLTDKENDFSSVIHTEYYNLIKK